jgi:hypothetical protein
MELVLAISSEATSIIRKKAATEWPDDFEMQRHVVRGQTEAAEKMVLYTTKLDQENSVIKACLTKALSEWPEDFEMQVHVFEGQMEAAPAFFEYSHPTMPLETLEGIKTKAFSEWTGDFEMMLHVLREQVDAWEELYG